MYNVTSNKAQEFIDHEEIMETLSWAEKHKSDRALIESILEKAKNFKGLTHREAAVLLDCDLPDLNEKMQSLAKQIKEKIYGKRIVLF
ncbi:MAG TPA: [FeFe] hydrogenase H-cluster radical SAM maturase HydG, partial [Treponemataceae bacterium]|nr:[FeFe] hydrogenase H-cluster radical SAM maturase HydG [Treponemataceae bacterium]